MLDVIAFCCRFLLLLLLAQASFAWGQPPAPLRFGVLSYLDDEQAVAEWAPVRAHLERAFPEREIRWLELDHESIDRAAEAQQLDFFITNPGHYVELEARFGASRLLSLQTGHSALIIAAQAVGAAVVTRADDLRLQRLQDLRGVKVAIVGQHAFAGYQLVWRELAALGIEPARELRLLEVGLPMENVLAAVAAGEADAGFVRACMLESRAAWQAQFRVVAPRPGSALACASSTRVYPSWPLAALPYTDARLARRVTIALLQMHGKQEEGGGAAAGAGGHISWTVPADYQAVHELQRELKIGPYADLALPTLTVLVRRYWPWLVAVLGLIVLGGLYTFHVERQVQARTAALRAAAREREELQSRLRESRDQAEHMARLSVLGELSGTLAHELSQPLAAIANYAHSLVRRADGQRLTTATAREVAVEIGGQAERAAAVLNRIRAFARKRQGQRQAVNVRLLVEDAVQLFAGMQAQAPPVEVIDRLPATYELQADGLQVQQVVLNLLKNGWDATRALGPERQQLLIELSADAAAVYIAVRDQGEPVAELEQLFDPFFTTKEDGMGLGLSICRSIAEAHGGRLEAAADSSRGMVFTLRLPREH